MPKGHQARVRSTKVLLAFALLLIGTNVWLAAKLLNIQHSSFHGCLSGNVQRADMRLLLLKHGYVRLADNAALDERPCYDLYGRGLRP